MANPVTHFEINARDAKAAQKFYSDLFGWHVDTSNPTGYGLIDTHSEGRGIGGGIGASRDGRSWVTFYVEVPDLAATLATAERLGGRTIMPPTDVGMVALALFSDPEGNVIGLAKETRQPPPRRSRRRKVVVKKAVRKVVRKAAARRGAGAKHPARRARGR